MLQSLPAMAQTPWQPQPNSELQIGLKSKNENPTKKSKRMMRFITPTIIELMDGSCDIHHETP